MSKKLNSTIRQFYLDEINAVELADIYYDETLYSAAAGYYQAYISTNKYSLINTEKSYCLYKLALCYLKQTNNNLSGWQYQTIYECLRSAINYNPQNYKAYSVLIHLLSIKENANTLEHKKDIYYLCEYVIMHLLPIVENEDINDAANMIIYFYQLCEDLFICKYKGFELNIINFLKDNVEVIANDLYNKIIESIYNNHNKDELEQKLMDNTYFKL